MICNISENAPDILTEYIKSQECEIRYIKYKPDSPIGTHPDLYMCKLGVNDNAPIFYGDVNNIGNTYPNDAIYNAACTGKFFIHNMKITAPDLLKEISNIDNFFEDIEKDNIKSNENFKDIAILRNIIPIHVNQGYSKCNICIVDENSIITEDPGIAKACTKSGVDVLKISRGYVRLPNFEYGFIGGASGRINDILIFNGNLSIHPDFENIKEFVHAKGLCLHYFPEYPLTDIGSIIAGK